MPRKAADDCMVCYPDPCSCFAPKKQTAPRKKAPAGEGKAAPSEPASEVSGGTSGPPRQDLKAKMKAAAAAAPPRPPAPQPIVRAKAPTLSDEDLLLNGAIRALAGILHPDEKARWGMVATSNPSAAERAAEWKARRRWQSTQA